MKKKKLKIPRLLTLPGIIGLAALALVIMSSCQSEQGSKVDEVRKVSQVQHPDWSRYATIYEVNIRQYTPEGTFEAFESHLPRLRELGVDILWLMPIHPIGEKNRKGELGSYYSVKDYYGVNPEFGTMEDFKELVESAHQHGMHVIIDWVANHTSWDNKLTEEHPEWYDKDSTGNYISPHNWTDVIQLDFSEPGLREYMKNALKYWVIEADIDGYRCDVAGMVPTEFWNDARLELEKLKPVFMLAEAEEPEHHNRAFDMSYSWELLHTMNSIAKGEMTADKIDTVLEKNNERFPKDSYRMRFTTNHDENSWNGTVFERYDEGAKAFAALTFTVPGMPLIYSGQEVGLDKPLEFFQKDVIEWIDRKDFTEFYKKLIKLKHENKALRNGKLGGELEKVKTSKNKSVYAFVREARNDKIFVILNLTGEELNVNLKGKNYFGTYKEIFTGNKADFDRQPRFKLKPWEYRVYANH